MATMNGYIAYRQQLQEQGASAGLEALRKELIRRLTRSPSDPTGVVHEAIVADGPAMVPHLIKILRDRSLDSIEARGSGRAPVAAARLLGAIGDPAAIEPMLLTLRQIDLCDPMADTIEAVLETFGAAVVGPALSLLKSTSDRDSRSDLVRVLASSGARDDRILQGLVEYLEEVPSIGAGLLADYGDPRALPHLDEVFDKLETPSGSQFFAGHTFLELREAIERLGGSLTPAQKARLDVARESSWRLREALERVVAGPPARPDRTTQSPAERNRAKRKRKQARASRKRKKRG